MGVGYRGPLYHGRICPKLFATARHLIVQLTDESGQRFPGESSMGWDEAFDEAVLRRDIHYELGARAAAPVPAMGDRGRRS